MQLCPEAGACPSIHVWDLIVVHYRTAGEGTGTMQCSIRLAQIPGKQNKHDTSRSIGRQHRDNTLSVLRHRLYSWKRLCGPTRQPWTAVSRRQASIFLSTIYCLLVPLLPSLRHQISVLAVPPACKLDSTRAWLARAWELVATDPFC